MQRRGSALTTTERRIVVAAVAALAWYVTGWAVAGVVETGYVPAEQAISELFDHAASTLPRVLLVSGLLASAAALTTFGVVLHRRLPGTSPLGPAAIVGSGVATGLIVAFPCTAGCPGLGTTWTDTGHGVLATLGYGLLLVGPLLVGWRVRATLPALAAWSFVLGGTAVAVFVANQVGLLGLGPGAAQRLFNTTADAWYVVAAVWLLRGTHVSSDEPTPTKAPG